MTEQRAPMIPMLCRVLVVDEEALARECIAAVLGRSDCIEVCGTVGSAEEALQFALSNPTDLVLTEVRIGKADAIDLMRVLKLRCPHLKVLMFSRSTSLNLLCRAMTSGVDGWISKDAPVEPLLAALAHVARGGCYFSTSDGSRISFSDFELRILTHMALGWSNGRIAAGLRMSRTRVEDTQRTLMRKIDVSRSSDLLLYAIENHRPLDRSFFDTPKFSTTRH
jgi:two-component system response regulator DesR